MADVQSEKSLDDFFAKRDKKKKKEKGKGKETTTGPATAAVKKMKKEKEKSAKNENQDAQVEKVTDAADAVRGNFLSRTGVVSDSVTRTESVLLEVLINEILLCTMLYLSVTSVHFT